MLHFGDICWRLPQSVESCTVDDLSWIEFHTSCCYAILMLVSSLVAGITFRRCKY